MVGVKLWSHLGVCERVKESELLMCGIGLCAP